MRENNMQDQSEPQDENNDNTAGSAKNNLSEVAIYAGTGAAVGAGISASLGGMGLAVAGTAVGIGMAPVAIVGGIVGLAAYGLKKAFFDNSSQSPPKER
jgi:hypothetical protein